MEGADEQMRYHEVQVQPAMANFGKAQTRMGKSKWIGKRKEGKARLSQKCLFLFLEGAME